ncbi:universal stress protein [Halalkalicoccus jeotgali]|uniref:Stress response protein n=1 Tax=Halalkalicoccus jeotgali (strain DSM 18796 / CECT 7217 / JCM 14584 / KCTC 4019 / B3) TaxID=795797 RepID=D8J5C9_HALJB|nr:universal stress protein [Halalkalicoccus jeotgali]ADJ15625.1 stress response protein [Halalkalicoccus jeotgali B3]ELY36297.1 stress response protein [Halalkalicoccus jeotgali B3]
MDTRILVPIDESEQSETAFEYALETFPEASITVLHAIDPRELRTYGGVEGWIDMDELAAQRRAYAQRLVDEAREHADERGITLSTAVETGKPARTVVEFVKDNDIDHVVIGSHGRSGVSRVLLGSVAERVVRRSPVPVTIVR